MFHDLDNPDKVDELMKFLVTHEVAEEAVPFPVAKKLPGGEEMVSARIQEQSEAEKKLDDIDAMDGDEERLSALKSLEPIVLEHAAREEGTVYTLLSEQCSPEELQQMGDKFMKIKSMAPTHPHPHAPDSPPGNKVLGPIAGFADRLRDSVKRGSGQEPE